MSQLEILVQSAQALLEQSRRIDNVEKRLDAIEQERDENGKLLLSVSMSSDVLPEMSMRNNIRQLVNNILPLQIPTRGIYGIRFTINFIIFMVFP